MKYFIAHITQQDGEHEHTSKFICKGETAQEVRDRIELEQLYEYGEDAHENSMLSYFDGQTAVSKYWLQDISETDFNTLNDKNYMGQI